MSDVLTEAAPSSDYLKVEMIVTARCLDCGNTDCEHALAKARSIGDELMRLRRLKDAIVAAARAEREAYEAPLTPEWIFPLGRAQKALRLSVDTLLAFEAEHGIGE
jgi:hypothetical protein